jgi:hypothetical protein
LLADDAMPPCPSTGFPGVTACVYGTYAAYIFAARKHMWISTFRTANEAARA